MKLQELFESEKDYHAAFLKHTQTATADTQKEPFKHHRLLNKNSEENRALRGYSMSSTDINDALIRKRKLSMDLEIRSNDISKTVNNPKNSITRDTIIYSGVGHKLGKLLSRTKNGKIIHLPAFISATTSLKKSKDFTVGDIAVFHLPKGYSRARHLSHATEIRNEREVLLDKDTSWKKVGEEKISESRKISSNSVLPSDDQGRFVITYHHLIPV